MQVTRWTGREHRAKNFNRIGLLYCFSAQEPIWFINKRHITRDHTHRFTGPKCKSSFLREIGIPIVEIRRRYNAYWLDGPEYSYIESVSCRTVQIGKRNAIFVGVGVLFYSFWFIYLFIHHSFIYLFIYLFIYWGGGGGAMAVLHCISSCSLPQGQSSNSEAYG